MTVYESLDLQETRSLIRRNARLEREHDELSTRCDHLDAGLGEQARLITQLRHSVQELTARLSTLLEQLTEQYAHCDRCDGSGYVEVRETTDAGNGSFDTWELERCPRCNNPEPPEERR